MNYVQELIKFGITLRILLTQTFNLDIKKKTLVFLPINQTCTICRNSEVSAKYIITSKFLI